MCWGHAPISEIALYAPVKAFLERFGFTVKGEVRGCDVVAVRTGEPPLVVVAELKGGFTLSLLLQAADRMAVADEVWLAVRATRHGRDRDPRAHRLCRLLGLGLLAVTARGRVEILAEPAPYRPRLQQRKRRLLLEEFARRRGDPNRGGTPARRQLMTAYRQQALDLAAALAAGPRRPRDLRTLAPDAGRILLRNVYGWFLHIETGLYGLSDAGVAALRTWTVEDATL